MSIGMETAYLLQPFAYGRGYPTLKRPSNPAAGATITVNIPGSRVYRLLAVQVTLVTDATVANRAPRVRLLDGDGIEWFRTTAGAAQTASSTATHQWFVGQTDFYSATGGGTQMPLPDLLVPSGHTIEIGAVALAAGDQLQAASLFWEEFPIGGQGYPVGVQPAFPPETQ